MIIPWAKIMISDVLSKAFARKFLIIFEKCNLCFHFAIEGLEKGAKIELNFGKMNVNPYLCTINHLSKLTISSDYE